MLRHNLDLYHNYVLSLYAVIDPTVSVLPGSTTGIVEIRANIVGEAMLSASRRNVSTKYWGLFAQTSTHYILPIPIPVHPAPHLRSLAIVIAIRRY